MARDNTDRGHGGRPTRGNGRQMDRAAYTLAEQIANDVLNSGLRPDLVKPTLIQRLRDAGIKTPR